MLKYQETFKRAYSNKKEFDVQKIEKILEMENYKDIDGKNIAMEIILNNSKKPMFIQYLFFTLC